MRLAGKVAFITGGARGQGAAEALLFAHEGARVVIGDVLEDEGRQIAEDINASGGEAFFLRLDVTDEEEWSKAVYAAIKKFGLLNVVVNNAGITRPQLTLEMTEENWNQHMDINAKSIFLCSQAAARQMKARGAGCIINIGSILGRNAFPATLGYCSSKAAVDQMTRVMAIEWARYSIRVNCIASGYIESEMVDGLEEDGKLTVKDLVRRTPQRRLGSGTDIAKAVRFLASEDAGFITGEVLVVDGGWTAFGYYQAR